MPEKQIGERKRILVHLKETARMMEVGLDQARWKSVNEFGIDDCGHSSEVDEWERSCCSVRVKFVGLESSGGMGGGEITLEYEAWCEKYYDEDEEEDE
jgi:hypothetical protein